MDPPPQASNSRFTPEFASRVPSPFTETKVVKNVWCYNLDNEMNEIMKAATQYAYVGMDTEFPGICFSTKDQQASMFDYNMIRNNVNYLKIIQLGITFCTEDGKVAADCPTWQFNFRFDPSVDMNNAESMELLRLAGIDFSAHAKNGIEPTRFGELFTMSGLVLCPSITWIAFHGIYDFAYLLRILIGCDLPEKQADFLSVLHVFFPHVYDVKTLLCKCPELSGGLNHVAEQLQITRIGTAHQSGSDSRVTAEAFFQILAKYFHNEVDKQYDGVLFEAHSAKA